MSMKKLMLIGLLLAAAGAGIWWWLTPKKLSAEERFATAQVERGSITQTVSANGTLNPVKLVTVGSQVSGTVTKMYADFNDRVKAGQVLLEVDPSLMQAQLQQSEANVLSAKASLQLAEANEKRIRDLFVQEYETRQDLDQAVQALEAAKAQLTVAQAQTTSNRTNLDYTIIRSPVSGVVVSRNVDIGQTVAASFQTPTLFTIAQDLSKMQIDSSYAEADVGNIRAGQSANFRVDAFPNRTFHGNVLQVRLNPTTQQNVVTYDVVITVDNPEQILLPGMTAYVNITTAQQDNVLMVPNAALRLHLADVKSGSEKSPDAGKSSENRPVGSNQDGQKQGVGKVDGGSRGTVYILENGQPKAVRITTGITDSRMTEVRGGDLKEGDTVITADRQPPGKSQSSRGPRLF
ncbi:MAG: efflux RND transporter periplasmic adaptor subunit [Gallionellaceae bacterium]